MYKCYDCKNFKKCYVGSNSETCDEFKKDNTCRTCKNRDYDGWDDKCTKFGHIIYNYIDSTCSCYEGV